MVPDDNERTKSMGGFDQEPDRPRIERLGHFKIEATLGSGGMGTIYRAYDESMKRPVALKVLHSSLEISERAQSRFVREAWIAGQLDHPNIIKVFSRGEENKVSYLALELAEGGSLSDLVEQTRESIPSGSDVTDTVDQDYINDILAKFIELAGALEHIHSKGFIHRDIKPQNVLLSGADRKFKLTDFGIAHAKDMTRMTKPGDFIGTVRYMSPELLAAHRAGIDKRTDIYSLGVTLYEALTLTLPFKAESEEKLISEILAGHYNEARKFNRRIPVDLETVLMKACNHDPDLRYQTAAEFADDLQRIIDGRPVLARRPSLPSRGLKYVRRNYKTVLGVAAAVVVLVSVIIWSYYKVEQAYRSERDESAQRELGAKPTFTKIHVPAFPGYCALSPDGQKLVFVSDDGGLWVAPTHGTADPGVVGEPVKLAQVEISFNAASLPVWSADGKWIAFNARDTFDQTPNRWFSMFVIPSTGGELREVPVKHDGARSWYSYRISLSPNGQTIAFSADTSLIEGESKTGCIYSIPVAGGKVRRLTDTLCSMPAFSPDGKMLAYVQECPPLAKDEEWCYDVWVVPVDGGAPIQISDLPGLMKGPVWSPDSRMIAFDRFCDAGFEGNELFIVPLTEDYKPAASPFTIELPLPSCWSMIASWSSNNEIGIALRSPGRSAVYTIPVSGGIATQVAPTGAISAMWFPDGMRVLFQAGSLFSVPAEGGEASLVPITGVEFDRWTNDADVSPDGRRLILAALGKERSREGLFTVSADGGEVELLQYVTPDYRGYGGTSWSPDGKWIAFISWNHFGLGDLCVIPSDGGELRQLVVSTDSSRMPYVSRPAWSPDSKLIAYTAVDDEGIGTICVVPLEGGNPEIVVEFEGGDASTCVTWSPDGKRLAYGSARVWHRAFVGTRFGEKGDIWILSLDTKEPVNLKTGLDLKEVIDIDWSPDGEKLVFSAYWAGGSDFHLVQNFLPLSQPGEQKPLGDPESKEMTVRMVWSGDEIYSTSLGLGRLSPDGRLVSFSKRLNGDLAILELANREIRLFTSNFASWDAVDTMPEKHRPAFMDSLLKYGRVAYGSAWSPDGTQLAYGWITFSEEHGDLCLIGRDGTNKRTLTTAVNEKLKYVIPYDWSKDGEHILAGGVTEGDNITLLSISAIDGSAKGIDTIEVSPHEFEGGYFSPDGRYVAYTSPDNDIFLLSVDGKSNEPLVEHPAHDYVLGWSPDGRWVCFTSDRSGATDVWVMGVSNGKPQGEPQKVGRNIGEIIPLGITGEGSLYYGVESGIVDVYVATIDPEAGRLLTSPEKVTQRFEGTNDWPDWSPDGKYLLYRSDREASDITPLSFKLGAKSPLCVRSMETGEERELYVQLRWFNPHHYSPDGRFVIVQGVDNDGQNGLFQIDVETGLATILVKCAPDTRIRWATWSPDGDKLFYKYMVTSEEPTRLMQYDLKTRQEQELFREDSWPTCPALSPDGQWLAFQTLDEEKMNRSLNIMPADSGELREIVGLEGGEYISSIAWMPDGKNILYVKTTFDGPKQRELWQVSTEGGGPRNVGLTMDGMSYLSVHPDGRQIAFSAFKLGTEIWVMENFLPDELSQR